MEVAEDDSGDSGEEVVFFNRKQTNVEVKLARKLKAEETALQDTMKKRLPLSPRSNRKMREKDPHNSWKQKNRKDIMSKQLLGTQKWQSSKETEMKDVVANTIDSRGVGKSSPSAVPSKCLLDDSFEFAKRFKADTNFVHAKFAARKPLGLRVEKGRGKSLSSESRSKLERVLLHADIIAIKQSLDTGGSVSMSRGHGPGLKRELFECGDSKEEEAASKKMKSISFSAASDHTRSATPSCNSATKSKVVPEKGNLLDSDSPSRTSLTEERPRKGIESGIGSLPFLVEKNKLRHGSSQRLPKVALYKVPATCLREMSLIFCSLPQGAVAVSKEKRPPLMPAISFPLINKLQFRIPREKKKRDYSGVAARVGRLWREAIAVDPTGQWCGTKRICATKCSRSLLEYESWLKVRRAGDVADWREERAGQRSRLRPTATDPLGLRQISNSPGSLTCKVDSSRLRPPVEIASERLCLKSEEQRKSLRLSSPRSDVSHSTPRPVRGMLEVKEKCRPQAVSKEMLENLSSRVTAPSPVSEIDVVRKQNPENRGGHITPPEPKVDQVVSCNSLSAMVGRGRRKLRLGT